MEVNRPPKITQYVSVEEKKKKGKGKEELKGKFDEVFSSGRPSEY